MQDRLPVRRSHNKAPLLLCLALLPLLIVGVWEMAPARAADPTKGGILVLDDCDPDYKGKAAYADNLTFLDGSGRVVFRVSGLNNCESIGSNRMVAADPAR